MAIKITENGIVRYENEPNIDRELFPNTAEGVTSEQIAEAVADWLEEHPEAVAPVQDVQVNDVSIVTGGVAQVPKADNGTFGVVALSRTSGFWGLDIDRQTGYLMVAVATLDEIKNVTAKYKPIGPTHQHESTFYGLAKAAGDTTQSASSNNVGNYTDDAKSAIQTMLGIPNIIGSVEGAISSTTYSVGDLFLHGGALYEVTAAIASGDAIVPGTNCEQTTIIDILKGA